MMIAPHFPLEIMTGDFYRFGDDASSMTTDDDYENIIDAVVEAL